jgi:hypothetical protein
MASNDMDAIENADSSRPPSHRLRSSDERFDAAAPVPRMQEEQDRGPVQGVGFATALIAGGIAGTSVDVALFPIDTVKVKYGALSTTSRRQLPNRPRTHFPNQRLRTFPWMSLAYLRRSAR